MVAPCGCGVVGGVSLPQCGRGVVSPPLLLVWCEVVCGVPHPFVDVGWSPPPMFPCNVVWCWRIRNCVYISLSFYIAVYMYIDVHVYIYIDMYWFQPPLDGPPVVAILCSALWMWCGVPPHPSL